MKTQLFLVTFLLYHFTVIAQEDAWVYFTDKPNVTAQLSNPNSILSSAAIARKNDSLYSNR